MPEQTQPQEEFGSNFEANLALLRRALSGSDLRLETIRTPEGNRCAVACLEGQALPETVQAVRCWAGQLSLQRTETQWWKAAAEALRLPPLIEARSPGALATALREGYVAVFPEHGPGPLLGPTTLDLLFTFPKDAGLLPAVRRLAVWPRLLGALTGLLVGALLIAVTSYHHALIPGPFLVSMAATRQNTPFPIVLEMFLVALLTDGVHAATMRVGGRQAVSQALIASAVMITAAMQVGILGPIAGMAGIASAVVRDLLPNQALRRATRLWRYLFMGAAAGLGVYGFTLLGYVALIYLGEEELLGQRLWRPPGASS